jgi:ribosomal protein L29
VLIRMKNVELNKELKGLSHQELVEQCHVASKKLCALRVAARTSHIKDYSQFSKLRKLIARMKTFMHQKASV